MHLRHSLRNVELALHDFGVFEVYLYYFIYFNYLLLYFICHIIITKNIGKEEKK